MPILCLIYHSTLILISKRSYPMIFYQIFSVKTSFWKYFLRVKFVESTIFPHLLLILTELRNDRKFRYCNWLEHRGGKSGRFREFNSQKIFSKTRFDRKYLGKYHGIGSFPNQNSSIMVNSKKVMKKMT